MAWTERQRAMLAEMGLTVWAPEGGGETLADSMEAVEASAAVADANAEAAEPLVESAAAAAAAAPVSLSPVASMDWPALREAVAQCRACRLCEGRRNTVFGVGNERAQLMVVGEAPGEQEDRRGEPFVGPAGQLLDSMLRALGLTREAAGPERQVFIANTLKCRPPGNRNPEPDEMVKCEPFLQRQLALVQPRVILAMGRFAVQALLRSTEPIGRLRGRVHTYEGVPLVVTYHPAYLLRNLPDKAKAWDDLCLAGSLLKQE
jgi:DNA polymerase